MPKSKPRKRIIRVVVNEKERDVIRERAELAGMSMSGFARLMALRGKTTTKE